MRIGGSRPWLSPSGGPADQAVDPRTESRARPKLRSRNRTSSGKAINPRWESGTTSGEPIEPRSRGGNLQQRRSILDRVGYVVRRADRSSTRVSNTVGKGDPSRDRGPEHRAQGRSSRDRGGEHVRGSGSRVDSAPRRSRCRDRPSLKVGRRCKGSKRGTIRFPHGAGDPDRAAIGVARISSTAIDGRSPSLEAKQAARDPRAGSLYVI